MASAMHEPHYLVLLSTLVSVAAAFYFLSLSQQDTLAQRQQIPGIKFNTTNASSSTTLSNTTIMPEFDSDTNNKNNLSLDPCNMPPCPPRRNVHSGMS